MNDLIKDLMAQACFETEFDDNQNMPEMMEKFAELIVKECARVVEDAVDHREPASTYVAKIKQHFGVET